MLDGLRKAGLEIAPEEGAAAPGRPARSSATDSGAARADEGFWVAVLPFKYGGANADLTALAEGLTEEIVTGLSRFSYLRVIARSSTARYANEAVDVRSAGKELGARYVMEGNLRQAGAKLRLAVQLVDAASGAHLWAENYERTFSPEAVFELQDDLVPRIVSTVADCTGFCPEHERGRAQPRARAVEPLRGRAAQLRLLRAGHRRGARRGAVRPGVGGREGAGLCRCLGDAGVALRPGLRQGFNLQADSLASGSTAARRAVETAPSSPLAYFSLAQALFFQRISRASVNAAERAVALNPMDGNSIAFLGELLTYAGDWERGLALAGRAKQLNPNHPGWYWYADFYNAYRQGDDRGALGFALKVNLPGHWFAHAAMAAACGQLGERDAAAQGPAGSAQTAAGLRRHRRERHREVVGARVRGAHDRRLAQGGSGDCRGRGSHAPQPDVGSRFPSRSQVRSAPTRASGSPCCRSSTAGGTPASRRSRTE